MWKFCLHICYENVVGRKQTKRENKNDYEMGLECTYGNILNGLA